VLDRREIEAWIRGVVDGSFADYQSTALLMAIFQRGMNAFETADLTAAMMQSGDVINLSDIAAPKIDKHSTGGVGDKVSLVLAPLAAAAGLYVPMISGRGLGYTGGTLYKLESIPGLRVRLSGDDFRRQLGEIGVALAGQTQRLVPADRKLYALRDVTATVESIPLICASIMSKKLAEGIDALVLDVKVGRGAFMENIDAARKLATAMVEIGKSMGRPVSALLTDMNRPLGRTVGNAVEVIEAIECLKGNGPADVMEVTLALGVRMVLLGGLESNEASARVRLQRALDSGAALEKLRQIVAAQGGDVRVIDEYNQLPQARRIVEVRSPIAGHVADVDALAIAQAASALGASRSRAEDEVDHAVGISHLAQAAEFVEVNGLLGRLHVNAETHGERAMDLVRGAFRLRDRPVAAASIFLDEITWPASAALRASFGAKSVR